MVVLVFGDTCVCACVCVRLSETLNTFIGVGWCPALVFRISQGRTQTQTQAIACPLALLFRGSHEWTWAQPKPSSRHAPRKSQKVGLGVGRPKIYIQRRLFYPTNILSIKFLIHQKFLFEKNYTTRNVFPKNNPTKISNKNIPQQNFYSTKHFNPTKIHPTNFLPQKLLSNKNYHTKYVTTQKLHNKMFIPPKCLPNIFIPPTIFTTLHFYPTIFNQPKILYHQIFYTTIFTTQKYSTTNPSSTKINYHAKNSIPRKLFIQQPIFIFHKKTFHQKLYTHFLHCKKFVIPQKYHTKLSHQKYYHTKISYPTKKFLQPKIVYSPTILSHKNYCPIIFYS